MTNWNNNLIKKAIEHYKYYEKIEDCTPHFIAEYDFFARKENLKKHTDIIWITLEGCPNCTHIAAKKLLFQEKPDCWKYFERTTLFWTMAQMNDGWINHMKSIFEYSLYVERIDLLEILFEKTERYLSSEELQTNKEFINQKVYPSAQLVQFLIEKWLGRNPVKESINKYGSGYGIYQALVDNWEDFSTLDSDYWNNLCEYHLMRMGLQKSESYDSEEFLASGLIPMELLNIFKVRKKLGLDIPNINHELFKTPMAKDPLIPTGYKEELDVKFQLVKQTIKTKQKLAYSEVATQLENEYGATANLFL